MKTKREWLKLWDNAPINKFIGFPGLNAKSLREDGVEVTEDWARAMYLFQVYSGGGYISGFLGITCVWRALNCRYNVPYANQIGNRFFSEQLSTFRYNRNVPALLDRISRSIGNNKVSPEGELAMIFDIIKQKTGFEFQPTINIDSHQINRNTTKIR